MMTSCSFARPISNAVAFSRRVDLFGGSHPWNQSDWTSQDDRLRGGTSQSYLDIVVPKASGSPLPSTLATFRGNLNTTTLGGAGFASQRTLDETLRWDLKDYDGLNIVTVDDKTENEVVENDGQIYTIVLKDCIIRGEPDSGKEISWEWNFKPGATVTTSKEKNGKKNFYARFDQFKPYFRGRLVDPPPTHALDASSIKRVSIMIRSFFDQQDGPFSVTFFSISAVKDKDGSNDSAASTASTVALVQADTADDDGNSCPGPGASPTAEGSARNKKRNQKRVVVVSPGPHKYYDEYDEKLDGLHRCENQEDARACEREDKRSTEATGWWDWLCGFYR